MALAPEQKNPLELVRGWRGKISARTGITNFSADSATRALMDVLAQEFVQTRQAQLDSYYSGQLSRATGAQLDTIGEDLGLPRLQPTFASSSAAEQNHAFYVDSGTFGDINGGFDIVIPQGTEVFSDEKENELGVRVRYILAASVTLDASDTIGYVPIKAMSAGPSYNVGPSVLRNHNFTDYSSSGSSTLKCLNFFAILNGRSQESDDRYRFRLSRNYDRLVSRNDSRILLNALQVPGVLDTKVVPGYFGIGTAGVVVLGPDYETSNNLLSAVQAQLDTMAVPGLRAITSAATKVQVDFQMQLSTTRELSTATKRQLEADLRRVLKNALRSVQIGTSITLRELETSVFENARSVLKMGRREGSDVRMFKNVFLRRGSAVGIMSEREQLLATSINLEPTEFLDIGTVEFSYQ